MYFLKKESNKMNNIPKWPEDYNDNPKAVIEVCYTSSEIMAMYATIMHMIESFVEAENECLNLGQDSPDIKESLNALYATKDLFEIILKQAFDIPVGKINKDDK